MASTEPDRGDRLPTTGPAEGSYERYRFDTTADGEAIIYDTAYANAWIQAAEAVALEDWR